MLVSPAAAFSVLLILTGSAKLVRPTDTIRAVSRLGVPAAPFITYALIGAELSVGVLALVFTNPRWLAAQGTLFVLLFGWVVAALVSGRPIASCGCLGRADTPPTVGHAVLNAVAAFLSFAASGGWAVVALQGAYQATLWILLTATSVFMGYLIIGPGARLHGVVAQ